jgi:exodeoxyribonuclease VII small subunit
MAKTKPKDFEGRMQRLQEIVTLLESGTVPLEESIALYKEGMECSRACRAKLAEAQHELQLFHDESLVPFDIASEGKEGGLDPQEHEA